MDRIGATATVLTGALTGAALVIAAGVAPLLWIVAIAWFFAGVARNVYLSVSTRRRSVATAETVVARCRWCRHSGSAVVQPPR